MFFRRMFSRKDKDKERDSSNSSSPPSVSTRRHHHMALPPATTAIADSRSISAVPKSPVKRRASCGGTSLPVIQLTPLWEHIIRTRTLPEDLNPAAMFDEFLERLADPEWQVRQHALRVLIDVLLVMGKKADSYFAAIIPQLVENLGHPAPTVRKGSLDALRVYISETAMPETILLEVMDIGLNQRITNEPFGGRLTCGVMLSLPSLVHATLHTPKRNYILRSTIDMLIRKMTQVTHQEVTLKVLLRIRDLIGPREFSEYMTHGAYREFELLCNVYGLSEPEVLNSSSRSSWHAINKFEADDGDSSSNQADLFWRTDDDEEIFKDDEYDPNEKIIMETEIKINDDTLTMRILERKDNLLETGDCLVTACSDEEEITETLENSGIIHVLSDSELEDVNNTVTDDNDNDSNYAPRTPKRVTFGGEIVKMRTPDSDTTAQSDADNNSKAQEKQRVYENFLTVEIPNDCTKPLQKPQSTHVSPGTSEPNTPTKSISPVSSKEPISPRTPSVSPTKKSPDTPITSPSSPRRSRTPTPTPAISPKKQSPTGEFRSKSASASPFRRISISPVDAIISPRTEHKAIEVLHNLQRSPCVSPRPASTPASRRNSQENEGNVDQEESKVEDITHLPIVRSWEELGIVSERVLKDLKSGDWRHRLEAIASVEEALKSSDNLAKIQPCLDTLLRMLLSSERHPEIAEDKRRIVINLISRLPLENLENRSTQIITGLCRQGGAGSNRVCKSLMQRLPPSFIVLKLLSDDFLHARSSRFRENALQIVTYALMTFPSTCFDTATCINRAIYAALDRKRRVRQASLDVLAVLGQVTSPRAVLDSVQTITENRDDGKDLGAAVKARLARKQLPIIGPDGSIQYALRVPSPHSNDPLPETSLGADVEWIISGIGSVSPTSLRRRSQRFIHSSKPLTVHHDRTGDRRLRAPHEVLGLGVGVRHVDDYISTSSSGSFQGNSDDTDDSRTGFHYSLATGTILQYKTNNGSVGGDIFGVNGTRIASRSLSDSNSDASGGTYKLPVASRFPAMDVAGIYVDRQSYRNPYEPFNLTHFRGISTYPKVQARKQLKGNFTQGAFNESQFDDTLIRPTSHPPPPAYESTLSMIPTTTGAAYPGHRRFTNVDKFIGQSNKPHHNSHQHSQHNSQNQLERDEEHNEIDMNRAVTNGHHAQVYLNENRFISKSAIHLDRAVSSKSTKQDLEETQSFKQIDSIERSSSGKKDISNQTSPTKTIEDRSSESLLLPNSVEAENKSATLSAKSVSVENLQPRSQSVQSKESIPQHQSEQMQSRPVSTQLEIGTPASRPETVLSNHKQEIQSRPQSIASSTASQSTEKMNILTQQMQEKENLIEPPQNFDEVDKAIEMLVEGNDSQKTPASSPDKSRQNEPDSVNQLKEDTANHMNGHQDSLNSTGELEIKFIHTTPITTDACEPHNPSETPQEKSTERSETLPDTPKSTSLQPTLGNPSEHEDITPSPSDRLYPSEERKTPVSPSTLDIFESPLPIRSTSIPSLNEEYPSAMQIPPTPSAARSTPINLEPTLTPRHSSMVKSNDSIFNMSQKLDNDMKSTESTTSSDYPPSHATSLDEPVMHKHLGSGAKTANLPLIRKSKTTLFGRHRRVSPVKQSIKLTQPEVFPQTLMKFDKPKDALSQVLIQLDSGEWEIVILGLRGLVRLMRHHPEILDAQMHIVCIQLGKAVRNLRSQVSRAACQASTELFTTHTRFLEQECDDLVGNLLHRTADTNRFLRADATRALESMCDNLAPAKIIHVLSNRGASHQNAAVRTATAKLSNRLVDRIGYERVFSLGREHRDKLLLMGANLLMEGSLETRSYTKALFRSLAEYAQCGRVLKEVIPIRTYRNIEKTLKSIM